MACCVQDTWSWQFLHGNMSACLGPGLVSTSPAHNSANNRLFLHEGRMVGTFPGWRQCWAGLGASEPILQQSWLQGHCGQRKVNWDVPGWRVVLRYIHTNLWVARGSVEISSVKDTWILWADLFKPQSHMYCDLSVTALRLKNSCKQCNHCAIKTAFFRLQINQWLVGDNYP